MYNSELSFFEIPKVHTKIHIKKVLYTKELKLDNTKRKFNLLLYMYHNRIVIKLLKLSPPKSIKLLARNYLCRFLKYEDRCSWF
jgi:hypothetical protein